MNSLNEINFHDGYITNFKTNDKNVEFEFIDGFEENKIFKIKLSNVEILVQEYKMEIINYVIDRLLNTDNEELYVFDGEYGVDNNKEFLKIWIDYPLNADLSKIKEYNNDLNGIFVQKASDYDDVGQIFIKFVANDIEIIN